MAPVNGVELYYEIHGNGMPLLFLHGGLGHSGHWKNQLSALSEHYKVVTVDSCGHGRSTMTDQQISFALMASDIVALMDYLEIERAHILGWSDGGNIGQMWASEPDFTVEQLGSISAPVLLLDGESDEAIYTEHTIEMAGLIPTAKLTFIAGTGHSGMWEKPLEINNAILDFLKR